MENRLKFRVYDIRRKVYFNDPVPPLNSDGTLAFQSSHPDFQKYYITEFCTGLSDKNGKLIFEGDIIKYCINWRAYVLSYIRIVAWDKNTCGFIMLNAKNQVKPLQKWKFPDPDTHNIEIVGNIHEQKD